MSVPDTTLRLRNEGGGVKQNPYYLRVAKGYQLLKWGTLLLFALYLAGMLFFGREYITYDTFLYLVRDLDITTDTTGEFTAVSYEEQQNMLFGAYQNTLVVSGSSGIRLFDGGGNCILSDPLAYKHPALDCGNKYFLLYDVGGTEYALFTSLTCVKKDNTEYVLQHAAVGENGSYCTVTRSDEAKYCVNLYAPTFARRVSFYLEDYVTAAAVHPTGDTVAVLTVSSSGWDIRGGLTLYSAAGDKMSVSLGDALPTAIRYLLDGKAVVITDRGCVIVDESGGVVGQVDIGASTLTYFDVSDNKVALVCRENVLGSMSRIRVLDSTGRILCDEVRENKVLGVSASSGENAAYVLYQDHVECLSVLGSTVYTYEDHVRTIREVGGVPVFCYAESARRIPIETDNG